jgi:hypothetical protein
LRCEIIPVNETIQMTAQFVNAVFKKNRKKYWQIAKINLNITLQKKEIIDDNAIKYHKLQIIR